MPVRAADPLVGAVGEHLVLPDRHRRLEVVDEVAGGVERLPAVVGGRGDDDRGVADREVADPVHRGDGAGPGARAATGLDDLAAAGRGRSGGRCSRGCATALAVVVVADRPDEQGHPAGGGVLDRGQHLGDVERRLADLDQPHRAVTPALSFIAPTLRRRRGDRRE